MTTPVDPSPPRGMRDLLPAEVERRDAATACILDVYRRHGFRRIETPAVESLPLLLGSEGGENEKLVFKILKRGEKLAASAPAAELADLGLRFDLTVPLARYYAQNHARLPYPLKAIQIGPVWRAERPQRGRFRQFTQCDIDILGVETELAEVELILATTEALRALGLTDLTVRLNDRRVLLAMAEDCGFEPSRLGAFFVALDKLDKVGDAGVRAELTAAGHPVPAIDRLMSLLAERPGKRGLEEALAVLPVDPDDPAARGLRTVMGAVSGEGGSAIVFDPTLVRGMGYYTGQIFEIAYRNQPSSIAGGGRYDRMVGRLLGREVPACGFSIGFERIMAILQDHVSAPAAAPAHVALVLDAERDELAAALAAARRLREGGAHVSIERRARRWRRQLEELASHGFTGYALVPPAGAAPEVRPLGTGLKESQA